MPQHEDTEYACIHSARAHGMLRAFRKNTKKKHVDNVQRMGHPLSPQRAEEPEQETLRASINLQEDPLHLRQDK